MNKRKKHFAMLRAEEKRRKPPTKAQKRNLMSTYLKNMGGFKHNQLKSKSYEEIHKLFDNKIRRVNTFIPMDSEAESSEEKAKGSRKKILNGSFKRYSLMIRMLQDIDREDLKTLWKLVKTKHGDTMPKDEHERVLWGDLKVMFEPDIKSDVWRNLQGYTVTIWKLYDSCGVHFICGSVNKIVSAAVSLMVVHRLKASSGCSRSGIFRLLLEKLHWRLHKGMKFVVLVVLSRRIVDCEVYSNMQPQWVAIET
ncbi:hypothetical protein Tco_1032986 [Tanacetum coccineum]|uniref:Uncharacterized protein n=1 Tax=Tanacetum coccineum TaxID=301880 RepID=A0ABQ5GDD6_9ASTR